MAFWGDYFIFDGIPCWEFGLRLYEINGISSGDGSFSMPKASEDTVASRYKTLYYGVTHNEPLTFKMVFGADKAAPIYNMWKTNQNTLISSAATAVNFFDSWDREAISAWLSPVDGYKWLEIEQPDMEPVRYKCRLEKLSMIELGNLPIAFSCEVHCDSPFAYHYPVTYRYNCAGKTTIPFRNLSSYRGGYQPKLKITLNGSRTIQIINHTDHDRMFKFENLPQDYFLVIDIDNENGVITNNMGLNLYPYFNFEFFKLVYGDNLLKIVGNCIVEMICEFPVNVGG